MEITPVTVTPLDSVNSISEESGKQHMHFTQNKHTKNLASSGFTDIRLVDWSYGQCWEERACIYFIR